MAASQEIVFEELLPLVVKNRVRVVDVRDPNEIEKNGKIPGSLNIPSKELKSALELSPEEFETKYGSKKPDVQEQLVFHCMLGRRALAAYTCATEMGFTKSLVYSGSFSDWLEKKGPIEH